MPVVAAAAIAWFGRTVTIHSQWTGALGLLDTVFDDVATATHFGGSAKGRPENGMSSHPSFVKQPKMIPVVLPSDWSDAAGGFVVGYKHNISFRGEIQTGNFFIVFRPKSYERSCFTPKCSSESPVMLTELPRVADSTAYWHWSSSVLDPVARERALYSDSFYLRNIAKEHASNFSLERVLAFTAEGERSPALDNFNTPEIMARGIVNPG